MKKKNLKGLSLNKKLVSDLNGELVKGGGSGNMICITNGNCPTETLVAACSNHMCDSRLGGCPSYYCAILAG